MILLSVQSQGFAYALLIFLLCLIGVHAVKLARIGYRTLHKKLPPEPPPKQEKKPDPVYFLVERKKKRPKSDYREPKEIEFRK